MVLNKLEVRTLLTITSGMEFDEHRAGTIYEQLVAKKLITIGENGMPQLTDTGKMAVTHLLEHLVKFAPSYIPMFDTKLSESIYHTASNITDHYKAIMRDNGLAPEED